MVITLILRILRFNSGRWGPRLALSLHHLHQHESVFVAHPYFHEDVAVFHRLTLVDHFLGFHWQALEGLNLLFKLQELSD